jgi:hypothetical protein
MKCLFDFFDNDFRFLYWKEQRRTNRWRLSSQIGNESHMVFTSSIGGWRQIEHDLPIWLGHTWKHPINMCENFQPIIEHETYCDSWIWHGLQTCTIETSYFKNMTYVSTIKKLVINNVSYPKDVGSSYPLLDLALNFLLLSSYLVAFCTFVVRVLLLLFFCLLVPISLVWF